MQGEGEPRSDEFKDANAGAQIDTASLPDGIAMQDGAHSGMQIAQMNEQVRMAQMSGQLGIAAAKATPASLMQDHVVAAATDNASEAPKLPPATVGPYSMRLAAVQGDASAQFEVASRLAEGKGTDQDLIEASQWYQRAAAQGFPMAQFRLGTLYERGIGVKADAQRAQVWYERAAGQGNIKAMHNLAVLIASRGNADYKTAAGWFTTAAEHGLGDSQFNLAILFENGMGVEKNPIEAYKWLVLAAKSGDKDASARRDAMKAKLTPAQIEQAQNEVDTWRAKPITGIANDARFAGQAWRGANSRG
jgi:localization factor PodJL